MIKEFAKKLHIELNKELPGFSAQKMMAPLGRKPPEDYLQKGVVPRDSAVLILNYPFSKANSTTVKTVLILRADQEGGTHAGQVAFPGGGVAASDNGLGDTALRETEEEIGVDCKSVSLIGTLTPLYIPVSNYMVHPFVGVLQAQPKFSIHSGEVKGLLEVPLNELMSGENRGLAKRYVKFRGEEIDVPCFNIQGQIIWGATAMIISEFVEIIRRAF